MFMHAGAGTVVRTSHIVGIFDLDGKITTADTADFLRRAERAGITVLAGDDLPKCFVLEAPPRRARTRRRRTRGKYRVIFSHISSSALAGRDWV